MGISRKALESLLSDGSEPFVPYVPPTSAEGMSQKADEYPEMDENFFRYMVENATVGIFVTSSTGKALYFNHEMANLLGAESCWETICGYQDLSSQVYVDPDRREEFLRQLQDKGRVEGFKYKALKKDGSFCWIRMNAGILKTFTNGSFLIHGFAEDVTLPLPERNAVFPECSDCSCSHTLNEIKEMLQGFVDKEEEDRHHVGEKIFTNYERIILPYIEKLKKIAKSEYQQQLITILEMNLKNIISPFSRNLSGPLGNFSPAEIQVADLIRHGKSTKEIAEILNTGIRTVSFHRENIRKKLDLKNTKVNLRTFLLSL